MIDILYIQHFLRQNKLIVGLIFPVLKTVEVFSLWQEADIALPDFTKKEISEKVARIFKEEDSERSEITEPKFELKSGFFVRSVPKLCSKTKKDWLQTNIF